MKIASLLLAALLAGPALFGQEMSEEEQRNLGQALAEAGSSQVEFIRALEKHLAKYPKSSKTAEIERALVKAAIEVKDDPRVIQYGERVLSREQDDLQVLERVARALLSNDDKAGAEKALKYAKRYEELVAQMRNQDPPGRVSRAQYTDDLDRGTARALALEARATGNLGKLEEAMALARRSYQVYATAEGARETARWLMRLGREEEAVTHLADAFTISDYRNGDAERAKDRQRMGELYRKLKGTEKGLGDLVLESYDRTSALVNARQQKLAEGDPNAAAKKLMEFTLSGLKGDKLALASLKGRAVIFDFWATWCGPCRAQYPLYEKVKERFRENKDVVFLSVNSDEDRSLVEPFLVENKWHKQVYFEDGIMAALRISSIPTTIVVNRRGEVVSRLNGFLPERFVDMLTERIEDALK
jgi:thiol-disulfide isomerase/thioredoxin